ncbi:hypothetical protein AMTR_s00011p00251010 [Amborella trichopoda]|uniref:Uncharacterized protein n=1 Tax=Amborella trichopoda TaxID=13333 RepID=W1NH04_AMBTC|nr:hypothetical protein AMTR_s00011p00251010 [Amborella trichopoda]
MSYYQIFSQRDFDLEWTVSSSSSLKFDRPVHPQYSRVPWTYSRVPWTYLSPNLPQVVSYVKVPVTTSTWSWPASSMSGSIVSRPHDQVSDQVACHGGWEQVVKTINAPQNFSDNRE